MNQAFFAYSGLVNAVTSIGLAVFILITNPKSSVARRFVLFALTVAVWSAGYFIWMSSTEKTAALFWMRAAMTGCLLIPFSFTFFVHRFLEIKRIWLDAVNFILSSALAGLSFTSLIVYDVEPKILFSYWPVPGIFFHLWVVHMLANTLYAHVILWRGMETNRGNKKIQIQYVFLGTLIGFLGGLTNNFLWYNIPVLPVLNILVSVYVVTVGYAIVKHKLMDIEVVIRQTMIFGSLLGFSVLVFAGGTFLINEVISRYIGVSSQVTTLFNLILIVTTYDPIRRFLAKLTDKKLFQKKYDYRKLLKDASRGMSQIESLDHLLGLVVHFVTLRVRVRNASVLMRRNEREGFWLCFQRGYEKNFVEYQIPDQHSLITYLVQEKEALETDKIQEYIARGVKSLTAKDGQIKEYHFQSMLEIMRELQAVCCIPSFLGKELKNILLLGEKKNGDPYAPEDISVLYTLAQESAIAIENARLFDEAGKKTQELKVINEQLEYSRNKLMKALKETEVANKQLQDTQAQLIHEQKMATLGRLAASVGHEVNNPLTVLSMNVSRAILKYRKDPNSKIEEIMDLFTKMEQNVNRIKAVVNTLTGLLKKSEKGKFEPLSLKLILEETLPLVQFQTYLDNLTGTEVEFDISGNIPLIRGDLERLQEVFLNLFINAYHAMGGKRNRRIKVVADVDPEDDTFLLVQFTDNGSGMTEEVQKKIFNYGFTTKPPGKGSGMGLYMCKYIIELHGGTLRVKSTPGVGTTFLLTLPIAEESLLERRMAQRQAEGNA